MPYQWPQDPQDLFVERYPQMVNTGLPSADVDGVRDAISEMWPDAPGGWVHEWSRLAESYAAAASHDLAALAYGWARFPVLADDAKRAAHGHQLEQYLLAARDFPVDFEREILEIPFQGSTTRVPVHLLAAPDLPGDAPVVIASGGVDSWKMDLHTMFLALALNVPARALLFDIPGTGESSIPLSRSSAEVVEGLAAYARELGNGRVAHLGVSMGGYFSALTGLSGAVDAAIVLGGPVEAAFEEGRGFQFGMADIVGNAFGFDRQPTPEEISKRVGALSLRELLDSDRNGRMLVINGADDVHIPQHDTLVFQGRRDTQVELLEGTGHCAVTKLAEVAPTMFDWLNRALAADDVSTNVSRPSGAAGRRVASRS
jgi:esterase FrsA